MSERERTNGQIHNLHTSNMAHPTEAHPGFHSTFVTFPPEMDYSKGQLS